MGLLRGEVRCRKEREYNMDDKMKRNCSSCKFSWLNRCKTLKKELNRNGFSENNDLRKNWEAEYRVKHSFICDKYKSMYIEYPIKVSKINVNADKDEYKDSRTGKVAKIRPCGEEYGGKTYLGLYLGEMPDSDIDNVWYVKVLKQLKWI